MSADMASNTATPLPLGIRQLAPALGAEILGVDLQAGIDAATAAALRDAWHRHQVILLRDQNLDEETQVAIAGIFGELGKVHVKKFTGGHPSVMYIGNLRDEQGQGRGALPDGEMHFHIDQCYQEKPAAGSMLFAIEVPRTGGNTLFASGAAAYESLSPEIQARLEGLQALNVFDYGGEVTDRSRMVAPEDGITFAHPVVRTHPVTGRRGLFVNRLMTHHIIGLPEDVGEALLMELFAAIEQPAFVYEHVWRVGDLLLWDNRATLHARGDFDPAARRWMRRVSILGDRPF